MSHSFEGCRFFDDFGDSPIIPNIGGPYISPFLMRTSHQIRQFCSDAGYRCTDRFANDVAIALSLYSGLGLRLAGHIYEAAEEEELIALEGTIPINYRRATYHIPVCIYLRWDHPDSPPICYVKPTSQMTIRESDNVDSRGKVHLPYLANWSSNDSKLQDLIHFMVTTFSERPPVFKKPEASMAQPASNSSIQSYRRGHPTNE